MGDSAPRRVLFLGDSLVAGIGDPGGGGWVARVVSTCFANGSPLTAYNLGVRRETSVDVVARWRAEVLPRVAPGMDARIVVSFGVNDTTIEDGTIRVHAEDSCGALARMLDEAGAMGMPAFVVGPAPVDDVEQNLRIETLDASFAEVCARRDVPFASVFEQLQRSQAWMSELSAGDGAHPGAEGYGAIAQLLTKNGLLAWVTDPLARP